MEYVDGNQIVNVSNGYSGVGQNKNNICSMASVDGVIPSGSYKITSILCAIHGTGSSRVFALTPLAFQTTSDIVNYLVLSICILQAAATLFTIFQLDSME